MVEANEYWDAVTTHTPAAQRDPARFDRTEVVDSKTVDYMLYRGLLLVGFGYIVDDVDSAGRPVYEQPSDHLPLIGNFMVRSSTPVLLRRCFKRNGESRRLACLSLTGRATKQVRQTEAPENPAPGG